MAPSAVCNEDHRYMVPKQLRQMSSDYSALILELVCRNTASAISLEVIEATRHGEDPIMLVLAGDHVIRNAEAFRKCVIEGNAQVEKGKIITRSIVATHPETGDGYLKAASKCGASKVAAFVEKSDTTTAQIYFDSGDYLWNSGIFMFKASRFLSELDTHCPDILEACQKATANVGRDHDFTYVNAEAFAECLSESIDYAVMEKGHGVWEVPMGAGWNDIASWSPLRDIGNKDSKGNVCHGDVILQSTSTSTSTSTIYNRAENKMIGIVGLDKVIGEETKDTVLVANGDNAHHKRKIVDKLKAENILEHGFHREVYRRRGKYDSIGNGEPNR
jgi:mannose-1-phosphate guanylyltransferase/mannose-6-phosphate isomerase